MSDRQIAGLISAGELEEGSVSHLGPPSVEQWSVQSPVILQPSTAKRKYKISQL